VGNLGAFQDAPARPDGGLELRSGGADMRQKGMPASRAPCLFGGLAARKSRFDRKLRIAAGFRISR